MPPNADCDFQDPWGFWPISYNQEMSEYAHFYTQVYVFLLLIFCPFLFLFNIDDVFFFRIIVLSAELALYVFVYDNFHLVTLPWDSPWTWYICFIGVDFIYYWFHRAAHGKLHV